LYSKSQARADWRALTAAALAGSSIGLVLGAAYMAGGLARTASDHARATRLAQAASAGFSETALQGAAARMDAGVLRVARRHDPFTVAGAPERDRQSAIFAARLERDERASPRDLLLRASFDVVPPAPAFRMADALDETRELDCLTQAVYFEARGETPTGQAAVAQVVLNRVRHPAFPKSVCAVVFQGAGHRGCQFSFACNGSMRQGREGAAWTRARKVASRALAGFVVAEVGSATHFHTTGVSPAWGPSLQRVAQVGLHVFYRFGRSRFQFAAREAVAPELTAQPVYSGAAPAAPDLASNELRLTSLVLQPQAETAASDAGAEATASAPKAEKASTETVTVPEVAASS